MYEFRMAIVAIWLLAGAYTAPLGANETSMLDGIKVEFQLLDRDGELVNEQQFRGKNVLLAFGFTHCLHICPLIAANMANTLKIAEKDAVGVFISVDTERDTPAITDVYARGYSGKMMGLGGSFQQVAATVKNFNATYVVTKSEHNYTVQHTPSIFLIGPDGKIIEVFAMNAAPRKIAAAMK
jgi:protein SCO1/2